MVTRSAAVRWLPLAVVVALLGAAMLAAVFGNPSVALVPPGETVTTSQPIPSATPEHPRLPEGEAPPSDVPPNRLDLPAWLVGGACLAVVLALGGVLLWLIMRGGWGWWAGTGPGVVNAPAAGPSAQHRVRAAVQEGLLDLDDADLDPRRSVIACWVRLEQAAAEAGTVREPGDTSSDLVRRLLATQRVSHPVLDRFAAVYREARYAAHTIDSAMRDEARAALRHIRDELLAAAINKPSEARTRERKAVP